MFKSNLRKETNSILGVLSGTLEKLEKVSQKAFERISVNSRKIETLETENEDLRSLTSENSIVIGNINKLLGK